MKTVTTDYPCDLCGAEWREERDMSHELPDIHSFTDPIATATLNMVASTERRPDYCDLCVEHVGRAVTQAKAQRSAPKQPA